MQEEIAGKSQVLCDLCGFRLRPEENENNEHLQAKFNNSKGEPKDYHFCSQEHLRTWLNNKAKTLRKSKAAEFVNGSWELSYEPIDFTQSPLWLSK